MREGGSGKPAAKTSERMQDADAARVPSDEDAPHEEQFAPAAAAAAVPHEDRCPEPAPPAAEGSVSEGSADDRPCWPVQLQPHGETHRLVLLHQHHHHHHHHHHHPHHQHHHHHHHHHHLHHRHVHHQIHHRHHEHVRRPSPTPAAAAVPDEDGEPAPATAEGSDSEEECRPPLARALPTAVPIYGSCSASPDRLRNTFIPPRCQQAVLLRGPGCALPDMLRDGPSPSRAAAVPPDEAPVSVAQRRFLTDEEQDEAPQPDAVHPLANKLPKLAPQHRAAAVNSEVAEAIKTLRKAGHAVSIGAVQLLVLKRLGLKADYLTRLGVRMDDLRAAKNLARVERAFHTAAFAYQSVRSFGSLRDFRDYVLRCINADPAAKQQCVCFEELGLGPLLKQPQVETMFPGSKNLDGERSIPTISVRDAFRVFDTILRNRRAKDRGARVTVQHYRDALKDELGVTYEESCLWADSYSFGLAISFLTKAKQEERDAMRQYVEGMQRKNLRDRDEFFRETYEKLQEAIVSRRSRQLRVQLEDLLKDMVLQRGSRGDPTVIEFLFSSMLQACGHTKLHDEKEFFAVFGQFAIDYVRQRYGSGVCRQCEQTHGKVLCEVCWRQQGRRARSVQREIFDALVEEGDPPPMHQLQEWALTLGLTLCPGMSASDAAEQLLAQVLPMVADSDGEVHGSPRSQGSPRSVSGARAGPEAREDPCPAAAPPVEQIPTPYIVEGLKRAGQSLDAVPQGASACAAMVVRLAGVQEQLQEQFGRSFHTLANADFLDFLRSFWTGSNVDEQEKEVVESVLQGCAAGTSPPPVEDVVEEMEKWYKKKGLYVRSFGFIALMEEHIVRHFGVDSWAGIDPGKGFVRFLARNMDALADRGIHLGSVFGADTEYTAEVKAFLADAPATSDLRALISQQFGPQKAARVHAGDDEALMLAAAKLRQSPDGSDGIVWSSLVCADDASCSAALSKARELASGAEEVTRLIVEVATHQPGADVGNAVFWDDVWKPKYGPLEKFVAEHRKDLSMLGAQLLVSEDMADCVRVYAVDTTAAVPSISSACNRRDWEAVGTGLWSLVVRGRVPVDLITPMLGSALERLRPQRHGGAGWEDFADALATLALSIPCGVVGKVWSTLVGPAACTVSETWEAATADAVSLHPSAAALLRRAARCRLATWSAKIVANVATPRVRRRNLRTESEPSRTAAPSIPVEAESRPVEAAAAAAPEKQPVVPPAADFEVDDGDLAAERSLIRRIRAGLGAENAPAFDLLGEMVQGDERMEEALKLLRTSTDVQTGIVSRSLEKVSIDMYSTDFHCVYELIQNADDNSYHPEVLRREQGPCLQIVLCESGMDVMNNEVGFSEQNISAVCQIGASTKTAGTSIGRKGMGFKSVFKISHEPCVFSNGFRVCFDRKQSFLMPHWVEDVTDVTVPGVLDRVAGPPSPGQWTTLVRLPFIKGAADYLRKLGGKAMEELSGHVLLFLRKLRTLTLVDTLRRTSRTFTLQTQEGEGEAAGGLMLSLVTRTGPEDAAAEEWFLHSQVLDVPDYARSRNMSSESSYKTQTKIQTAFVVPGGHCPDRDWPVMRVMAYLPTGHHVFRFLLQADFNLTADRASVNEDDPFNQWIREELAGQVREAFECIKKFIDLKEPARGRFPPHYLLLMAPTVGDSVGRCFDSEGIKRMMRQMQCVPTACGNWSAPAECVFTARRSSREFFDLIPADILYRVCNVRLVHELVSSSEEVSIVAKSVGVRPMQPRTLISVLQELARSGEFEGKDGAWFVKLFDVLDDTLNPDSGEKPDFDSAALRQLRILPVHGGRLAAATDNVFFAPEGAGAMETGYSFLHSLLFLDRAVSDLGRLRGLLSVHFGVRNTSPRSVLKSDAIASLTDPASKHRAAQDAVSALLWIVDVRGQTEAHKQEPFDEALLRVPLLCTVDDGGDSEAGEALLQSMRDEGAICFVDPPPGRSGTFVLSKVGAQLPYALGGANQRRYDVGRVRFAWLTVDAESYLTECSDRRSAGPKQSVRDALQRAGATSSVASFRKLKTVYDASSTWAQQNPPDSFKSEWTVTDWVCPDVQKVMTALLSIVSEGAYRAEVAERFRGLLRELAEANAVDYLQVVDCSYLPAAFLGDLPAERDRAHCDAKSSLCMLLETSPWVADELLVLHRPCDIKLHTEGTDAYYRNLVPYLPRSADGSVVKLVSKLGATGEVSEHTLAAEVKKWMEHETLTTSIMHMHHVYSAMPMMCADLRKAIWVPDRGQPHAPEINVQGRWVPGDKCFWKASTLDSGADTWREEAQTEQRFLEHFFRGAGDTLMRVLEHLGMRKDPEPVVLVRVVADLARLCIGAHDRKRFGHAIISELRALYLPLTRTDDEEARTKALRALWQQRVWPTHNPGDLAALADTRLVFDDDILIVDGADETDFKLPDGIAILGGGRSVNGRHRSDRSLWKLVNAVVSVAVKDGLCSSDHIANMSEICRHPVSQTQSNMPAWYPLLSAMWLGGLAGARRSVLDGGSEVEGSVMQRSEELLSSEFTVVPMSRLETCIELPDRHGEMAEVTSRLYDYFPSKDGRSVLVRVHDRAETTDVSRIVAEAIDSSLKAEDQERSPWVEHINRACKQMGTKLRGLNTKTPPQSFLADVAACLSHGDRGAVEDDAGDAPRVFRDLWSVDATWQSEAETEGAAQMWALWHLVRFAAQLCTSRLPEATGGALHEGAARAVCMSDTVHTVSGASLRLVDAQRTADAPSWFQPVVWVTGKAAVAVDVTECAGDTQLLLDGMAAALSAGIKSSLPTRDSRLLNLCKEADSVARLAAEAVHQVSGRLPQLGLRQRPQPDALLQTLVDARRAIVAELGVQPEECPREWAELPEGRLPEQARDLCSLSGCDQSRAATKRREQVPLPPEERLNERIRAGPSYGLTGPAANGTPERVAQLLAEAAISDSMFPAPVSDDVIFSDGGRCDPIPYEDMPERELIRIAEARGLLRDAEEPAGGWNKDSIVQLLRRSAPAGVLGRGGHVGMSHHDASLGTVLFDFQADESVTGRDGERIALHYLRQKCADREVTWVNEGGETGWPFDIVIGLGKDALTPAGHAPLDITKMPGDVTLVEVKATKGLTPVFKLSAGELHCAERCWREDRRYNVLRVLQVDSSPTVRMIEDFYLQLTHGALRIMVADPSCAEGDSVSPVPASGDDSASSEASTSAEPEC